MTDVCPVFVFPIYKEPCLFTAQEKRSLINNLRKLSGYKVVFLSYIRLEPSILEFIEENIDTASQKGIEIIYLARRHLSSISSYDRLLKTARFYQIFSSFSHLVIVQLDVWLFGTNIERWLVLPYAQIGAPWIKLSGEEISAIGVGNGGLSIRNINVIIMLLQSKKHILTLDCIRRGLCLKYGINEFSSDQPSSLIGLILVRIILVIVGLFPIFRSKHIFKRLFFEDFYLYCLIESNRDLVPLTPSLEEAASFAFETYPSALYAKIGSLPFGCHAFEKYEKSFWKSHIDKLL